MKRRSQDFSLMTLRVDAARFLCLCIMVLAVPILHPLAESRAAQNGLSQIICTQFGVAPGSGDTVPIGGADDSPCVILCGSLATGKIFTALAPASAQLLSNPLHEPHHRVGSRTDDRHPLLLAGKGGIRGPPRLI